MLRTDGRRVELLLKFVTDLLHVGVFSPAIAVSSTNKTDCHDIAEILLKVVLNTINGVQTHNVSGDMY
jgi:hypothetical protein